MADQHHHHHHQHRPNRLSVPPRTTTLSSTTTTTTAASTATTPLTNRVYPLYPSSTPTPTPSKQHRLLHSSSFKYNKSSSSLSFLLLLMFSLRSLYSLFPFLRSSPSSFSLFPFSFLVSLLSFLLTLVFSHVPRSNSNNSPRIDLFQHKSVTNKKPIFSLYLITKAQHKLFMYKSVLLAIVFVVRFQALRYCGTSAMILAELSGNVAARFFSRGRNIKGGNSISNSNSKMLFKIRGPISLLIGMFLLSISWDRIDCFPLSSSWSNLVFLKFLRKNCIRVWPMLLPFMSGFLGCYERVSMNWGTIGQLSQTRVRLISLFYTTILLLIPSLISIVAFESEGESISIGNLGWPLANTVVFGVLWSENFRDEKTSSSKDFQKEFFVTFVCTIVLELFYYPELSLWGLLFCGIFLSIAVTELDHVPSRYVNFSESYVSLVMKPIRHILSERKSRKIALFLLINTAYMVVEFAAGFMSNSLGLISDACHMLFDCAALAIGLYASYISRLPANNQFNYGYGRFEVLSGFVNAVFLVLVGVLIVLESFERILDPQEISTNSLLSVSIGGLVVNVVGLIFFHEEHHHAHGGSAACSHSHSNPHSHQQQNVHVEHDGEPLHDYHNCAHHDHTSNHIIELKTGETKSHKHDHHEHAHHQHDHHDHAQHQHDNHDHDHDHHQHNHHGHSHHQHNHHGHSHHQHNHHDHHHHNHDDHSHCHDHDDNHNHHHQQATYHSEQPLLNEPQKNRHNHHHIDHNMEGIFLHVLADTLGSVGVVLSTLLIKYKGWLAADPACSIFISVLIVSSVIPLLRNSAEILLQRVPKAHEQDLKKAINDVTKIKGVIGIQNLHVWSFTNTDVVGTLHLHVSTDIDKASIRTNVSNLLHDAGIKDLTLQVECVKSG